MDKLTKALDEVVAWFKKEEGVVAADVAKALQALHLKHAPAPAPTAPEAPAVTETKTDEGASK